MSLSSSNNKAPEIHQNPSPILHPPFSLESAAHFPEWHTRLPATFYRPGQSFGVGLSPQDDMKAYLSTELLTPKLALIHDYLWLSGLPHSAHALHRQILLGRSIFLTENPDEHLVWIENRFFIKPLPEFLLSYSAWTGHLQHDVALHQSACGLLLSYTWLVRHRSDYEIAIHNHLLPANLTWESWIKLASSFLAHVDADSLTQVSPRYRYGELRLTRLNSIYRLMPAVFSFQNFSRGFMRVPTWYKAFFQKNFAWLLAVFAFISVALGAIQVGLATDKLQASTAFVELSWGLCILTLVVLLWVVVVIGAVWAGLFWFHLLSTWRYAKKVEEDRRRKAGVYLDEEHD